MLAHTVDWGLAYWFPDFKAICACGKGMQCTRAKAQKKEKKEAHLYEERKPIALQRLLGATEHCGSNFPEKVHAQSAKDILR